MIAVLMVALAVAMGAALAATVVAYAAHFRGLAVGDDDDPGSYRFWKTVSFLTGPGLFIGVLAGVAVGIWLSLTRSQRRMH